MASVREMDAQSFVEESQNFAGWQSFVDSCDSASIFQTSYWAKAFQEAGRGTLLIIARDTNGEINGGMLSTYNEYSFLKLHFIPSIQATGAPLVHNTNNIQLLRRITSFFEQKAKELGASSCYVRSFFPFDNIFVNQLNYHIEQGGLPCTVIVDLPKSVDELWRNLASRGRRGIRKAERFHLEIEQGRSSNDLLAYYQICESTCNRLKLPLPSLKVYKSLFRTFASEDKIKLFLARYKGNPIAGVIVVRWKDKMWGLHGASFSEYWHLNPNLLIHWNIMKWGIDNGVKIYDLMGVPCEKDVNHPKYSLYLFKTQFGGKIVRHGEYVKNQFRLRSIAYKKVLKITYPLISLRRKERALHEENE